MKKKTLRKIVLTKETLRALNPTAVQEVAGGAQTRNDICSSEATCFTCPPQGTNC
jgi:hypothetical protein